MLRALLDQKKHSLSHFFAHLDIEKANAVLGEIENCRGVVIFTGVGKSGTIAQKVADTMTSTGTRALFLSPQNALHGDIGIVAKQDVFVVFSKSGESDEIFQLLPAVRNKGARIIAVVCRENSRLSRSADLFIVLPLDRELCPHDLAPTTSATLQLIFGDLLAVALMKKKDFSVDQYALNHPAGSIGKRITLKVRDLMVQGAKVPTCKPTDLLGSVIVELSNKRCGCVLVMDEESKMEGIFTDGDLRRALQAHGPGVLSLPVEQMMTCSPKWTFPEKLAFEAMKEMEDPKREVTSLPVLTEDKKVVGLIKLHDIIQSGL